eukprot:1214780-Pleurochrysis_carterae.AAC.2
MCDLSNHTNIAVRWFRFVKRCPKEAPDFLQPPDIQLISASLQPPDHATAVYAPYTFQFQVATTLRRRRSQLVSP